MISERNASWLRCSGVNVDFFGIFDLLLDTSSITYLRVRRNRSYTYVFPILRTDISFVMFMYCVKSTGKFSTGNEFMVIGIYRFYRIV